MTSLNTLTVYLGSSGHARPVFQEAAIKLGNMIGQSRKNLIYGGMDAGLMGLIASSALRTGGKVTGIIPQNLKDSERILGGLTETILVGDLWERKKRMFNLADAVIALPGGFGTLDESLEVLYWANLGLHAKPLALLNVEGYWNPLIAFLKTLPDFKAEYLIAANTIEELMLTLQGWKPPAMPIQLQERFPHFEDEICRNTEDSILIDKASVENAYYAACALGLKQLGKHKRAIGFLNKDGQFDLLLEWLELAAKETFITQKCLLLFTSAEDETTLRALLKGQAPVTIDLHKDKWGERKAAATDVN